MNNFNLPAGIISPHVRLLLLLQISCTCDVTPAAFCELERDFFSLLLMGESLIFKVISSSYLRRHISIVSQHLQTSASTTVKTGDGTRNSAPIEVGRTSAPPSFSHNRPRILMHQQRKQEAGLELQMQRAWLASQSRHGCSHPLLHFVISHQPNVPPQILMAGGNVSFIVHRAASERDSRRVKGSDSD